MKKRQRTSASQQHPVPVHALLSVAEEYGRQKGIIEASVHEREAYNRVMQPILLALLQSDTTNMLRGFLSNQDATPLETAAHHPTT